MTWVWALTISAQTPAISDSVMARDSLTFGQSVALQSVIVAEDFMVTRADGQNMRFYDLPKGKLTVLVFFDPDCAACRQSLFALKHSSLVNELIGEEVLQVMTVHVGYDCEPHSDLQVREKRLWQDMLKDMPETWMNTTAITEMRDSKCYDLSSLPAIYLLDADRKMMVHESHTELLIPVLQKLW